MTPVIPDVLVGVLQRNRTDKIFIYTFWRLSHMIVVVEILQAGEIGKLVGTIQSESKGLRTRGVNAVSLSLGPKA